MAAELGLWSEIRALLSHFVVPLDMAPSVYQVVRPQANANLFEDASSQKTLYRGDMFSLTGLLAAVESGHASADEGRLASVYAKRLTDARYIVPHMDSMGAEQMVKIACSPTGLLALRAEALAMSMARSAQITCLNVKLQQYGKSACLSMRRFDRSASGGPIKIRPARDLLDVGHGDPVDLLEFVKLVQRRSRDRTADLMQLWKRLALMRFIHHPGDDLRKVVFVVYPDGEWRLGPAFGLRLHAMPLAAADENFTSLAGQPVTPTSLTLHAEAFGLTATQAQAQLRNHTLIVNRSVQTAFGSPAYMSWTDVRSFRDAMQATVEISGQALRAEYDHCDE